MADLEGRDGKQKARPLNFFAQIELDGVGGDLGRAFPTSGSMLFFADFDYSRDDFGITGLYDDELLGARVVFVEPGIAVEQAATPSDLSELPEAIVAAISTTTFRQPDSDWDDELFEAFDEVMLGLTRLDAEHAQEGFVAQAVHHNLGGNHQLGGHARYIQHRVEEEVVQAHRGVYRHGGFDHDRWQQVRHEVSDWTVLFQFDSDDTLDLMWGDVGTLWWATVTDRAAVRDYSSSRFNFQCS